MSFYASSEIGLRDNNEDSYCAERIGDYYVFAVADGLGGHACGEVASSIAIECLKNAVKFYEGDLKTMLRDAVFDADEQILAQSEKSPKKRGMATTLIAACVDDDLNCTVVNVGDSRAHIITQDEVKTTKDHSVVNELADSGEIAPEDVWQHPLSNVLTQALGDPESVVKPDFYDVNLRDTFLLLTSDGLHDYIRKERIREIVFANGNDVTKSCRELVKEALAAGSDDNITIVLAYGMDLPS
ncbi:MAG: protein phosphatase 2C domain-containing protein [Methanoregula sp.]|nr:protein phosphatase 2C domain-containing protein [Methanoregula sp.]